MSKALAEIHSTMIGRTNRPGRRYRPWLAAGWAALLLTGGLSVGATRASADSLGLVTLSGLVTDSTGAPVDGTTVTYNGETDVTGADGTPGHYLLNVPTGLNGLGLSFTESGSTPGPVGPLSAQTGSGSYGGVSIGSVDVVENFVWPATTSVLVTAEDANSVPVVGAPVGFGNLTAFGGGPVTLSDGTPTQIDTVGNPAPQACTTDDNGHCSFYALVGSTPFIYSSFQLVPGNSTYPTFSVAENQVIAGNPAPVTLQFGNVTLTTLSGLVTDSTGAPVDGTTVTYNGETDVTGADGTPGHYLLNVPTGLNGLGLSFTESGSTPGPVGPLSAQTGSGSYGGVSIGSVDVVENFVWPATTSVLVTAEDANSVPVVGAPVGFGNLTAFGGGPVTLSDGTPTQIDTVGNPAPQACTTDDNGHCSFYALVGSTPFIYSSFQLVPGNSTYPTFSVAENQVIAGNPAPVTLQFVNIVQQGSAGSVAGAIFVAAPSGTVISNVSNTPIVGDTLPSGATVLTGALSYTVSGLTPGATISVTLRLPSGSDPTSVFKFQNGAYVDVSSIATISGDEVTLQLTDGGLGDADGLANGVIVDPVVPVRAVVPSAPVAVGAVPGNMSATVHWTQPSKNGGAAISGYVVTPYHGTTALASKVFGSSATSGVIVGLTNGQTYSFKIAAKNVVGTGPTATTAAIPIGPPGAPTLVVAMPGSGQVTVSWATPAPNGTSAITGYVLTPYVGTVPQTALAKSFGPLVRTATLIGLTNATSYTFRVVAKNLVGPSPGAASLPITVGAPVAPVVTAVGSTGQAVVSWTSPANNGSAVTSYVVRTYLGGVLQSAKTHTLTCTPQPCSPARTWTVNGLTNGSLYTFKVVAVNARGTGPAGATTIKVGVPTLPGVPASVHATAGVGSATVSWVAPANGSATITAYIITPYKAGVAQATITVGGTVTTRTITALTAGQSYTFKIVARNVVGPGLQSTASNAVTPT